MKIAYFTEWPPYEATGVLRKIIGQVTAWKDRGHYVRLYSLSPRQPGEPALDFRDHGEVFGVVEQRALECNRWARLGYINKMMTAPQIAKRVRAERPDIIYYRQQGPWYPGLASILRSAPYVMEVNTMPSEVRYWGGGRAIFAAATNTRLWSRAAGFVCVSHVSAEHFAGLGKPVKVVANSMWGSANSRLPPSGNASPAFVFVGSAGQAWHGLDKILQLAALLPNCHFHTVGSSRAEFGCDRIPQNVTVHGPLYGEDLIRVYEKSDVGLGTLALHRLGFDNTSSLKTLEYLMYGLPVVLGCRETADELNSADYTLRLPNTPTNVVDNAAAIGEFAERWRNRRVTADLSFLSRETLEGKRLEFFRKIVCGRQGQ